MSEKELRRRRVTRVTAAAKRGEKFSIEVRSCSGGVAKSCGSFTYLGSLTDVKGSSGPEIKRRIKKPGEAFRSVWSLWKMKGLSLKLKGRLYSAFVHSAMLYNCEVWNITKSELKDLEAKNVYLMRKVVGNDVWNEDERLSGAQLLGGVSG